MFSADLGVNQVVSYPPATDPPFQKVALLLHGDGTNGAQNNTFVDYSYPGGYAVSFDGTGDYLTVPSSSAFNFGSGDFTIEFWYYYDDSTTRCLLSIGNSTTTSINLVSLYGTYLLDWPTAYWASSLSIQKWNHVALVRAGTTFNCYINGTSTFTKTLSGSMPWASDYYVSIGKCTKSTDSSIATFKGFISNLRIVKGTALYTSTFTPSNLPLTAVSGTSLLTCQSATIVDNSPNAFTITANGDAAAVASKTITRTGNVAQGTFSPFSLAEGQWSNYFDGSGDYLTLPSNAAFSFGTGDFTVEWWQYWNGTQSSYGTLYNNNYSSAPNLTIQTNANVNQYIVYMNGTGTTITESSAASANQWYHYAVVRNGTTVTIYRNGVSTGSTTYSGNVGSSVTTYIGTGGTGPFTITASYLSNFRIVKGTAVYTANFTPSTTPLTAITNTSLLTCQSNRFKDNSSNNFTITRNGDTKVTAFSPFAPSAAYSASTNGGSGYFDGSGDYLSVADNANLRFGTSAFTIQAWVYRNAAGTAHSIVSKGGASTGFTLGITSTNVLRFTDTTTNIDTTTTIPAGTWTHVAAVRTNTSTNGFQLYINGVSSKTATVSTDFNQTDTLYVGADRSAANVMNGYITDLRYVNGTAETITVPTAPLTAVTNTQLLLNCTNAGIFDNAGKNDIETVGNAQISTSVKKYGTGSVYFDGAGDYLKIPNSVDFNFGTGNFTIEFWYLRSGSNGQYARYFQTADGDVFTGISISQYNTTQNGIIVSMSSSGASWNIVDTSAGTLTDLSWNHCALVRNGTNFTFYINGIGTSLGTSSAAIFYNGTGNVVIGGQSASRYLNGYIDDLRITKGQALYTSNFTPPTQAFPNV